MIIEFPGTSISEIMNSLQQAIQEESLEHMVKFELSDLELKVTISKAGTSYIFFNVKEVSGKTIFSHKTEKIALVHRAVKGQVKQEILTIVALAGGKIR